MLILHAASVYTEINAVSKGISIGVPLRGPAKGTETLKPMDETQPYVDLMGRR